MRDGPLRHRFIAFAASCALHVAVVLAALAIGVEVVAPRITSVVMAELVPSEAPRPVDPPTVHETPRPKPPRVKRLTLPRPVETPVAAAPEKVDVAPPAEVATKPEPAAKPEPPPKAVEAPPLRDDPAPAPAPPSTLASSSGVTGAPAEPRRSPATTFSTTSDFGEAQNGSPTSSAAADRRAAGPGPSAMAVPDGITQTAIPRGGYQVKPPYPGSARRLGIQGTTTLRVYVAADGRVADVRVEESAGHADLDHAAADAVRRWRFEPARRGKDPVGMWVLLPVEFRLR